MYTSTGRGQIDVWNPNGTHRKTIGHLGKGPGEYASGAMGIYAGPNHSLNIVDNNHRWTILDSNYSLVRSVAWRGSLSPTRSAVLKDGGFLDGERPIDADFEFSIARTTTRAKKTSVDTVRRWNAQVFSPVPPAERGAPSGSRIRLISYSGTDRFWAGPPQATGRGYELQEFALNGTLLRTIRRPVKWFLAGADRISTARSATVAPPTEIEAIHSLGSGLLWVVVRVTNQSIWEKALRAPKDSLLRNKSFDIYVDVLDTDAGTVIASSGPIPVGEAAKTLPTNWVEGTFYGFRYFEDSDGEQVHRRVGAQLFGK